MKNMTSSLDHSNLAAAESSLKLNYFVIPQLNCMIGMCHSRQTCACSKRTYMYLHILESVKGVVMYMCLRDKLS